MTYTLILILCLAIPTVYGINCYQCIDVDIDSNSALIAHTSGLSSNENCRYGDRSKLKTTSCPGSNACSKWSGALSGSLLGSTYSGTVTIRDCWTSETVSCKQSSKLPGMFSSSVSAQVSGTICSCKGDGCNGQTKHIPSVAIVVLSLSVLYYIAYLK